MIQRGTLFLASRSPRRRQLLAQLGVKAEVLAVEVEEIPGPGESALDYVSRVARAKAEAGRRMAPTKSAWVLGADTEVVLGTRILGKPANADEACAMLRALSERSHVVESCVWLLGPDKEFSTHCRSLVSFAALDDSAIAAYVASGEAFGKAGGYAIQGRAAAFITHLDGSYSGVMGLPLHQTAALLGKAGIGPPEWQTFGNPVVKTLQDRLASY